MSGSDAPLLLAGAAEFRAYPARWWMVGALSLVALMQGGVWNTWSPIAPAMAQLFGWGDGTLALLANWGPISYCLAVFPNSWAMDERGLRPAVLAAAGLVFGGCLARCFRTDAGSATTLIHAGQFLNGLAGPVAMSAAPVLSAAWFPAHERRTATALVESMNMLGVAISFVAGPYLVPPVAQADLPPGSPGSKAAPSAAQLAVLGRQTLLYMRGSAAVAALALAMVVVYFPSRPPSPPAPSAGVERVDFRAGVQRLLRHRQFWVITLAYGVCTGVYGGWNGFIAPNLEAALGHDRAESEAGWLGFWSSLAGVVAMPALGFAADRTGWSLRRMLLVIMACAGIMVLWFALLCLDTVALPLRTWSLYTSCILGGAFVFGSIPLFFEASVECTYPIAEGVTTGIMTLVLTCAFSFFYLLPTNSLLVAALTSLLVIIGRRSTTSRASSSCSCRWSSPASSGATGPWWPPAA